MDNIESNMKTVRRILRVIREKRFKQVIATLTEKTTRFMFDDKLTKRHIDIWVTILYRKPRNETHE